MPSDDLFDQDNPYEAPKVQAGSVQPPPMATKGIDLATENPFLTIWTRPRATIRGIVDSNPTLYVMPLAMIGGVLQALNRAAARNAGDHMSFSTLMIVSVVGGFIGGPIGLYIGAWLLRLTGRWLGGQAEAEEVRAAMAWFTVPVVATVPIWLLQLGLLGREMFTSETPTLEANPTLGLVLIATGVLEAALGIWSTVIALKCIGEVQRFSAWRALGSIILGGLIIIVPLMLLVLLLFVAAR